jgi:hypothetical protein
VVKASKSETETATTEWYRVRLTPDEYRGGELDVIVGAFRQVYFAHNAPHGMALLGIDEIDGGYEVYFTPLAIPHVRALVKAYSASPHHPPSRRSLTFICGDPAGNVAAVQAF